MNVATFAAMDNCATTLPKHHKCGHKRTSQVAQPISQPALEGKSESYPQEASTSLGPITKEVDLPSTINRAIARVNTWHQGLFASIGSHIQRQLLVQIIRCASWQHPHKEIHIHNGTLALHMNVSLATVKRGLQCLVDAGWISREQERSHANKFMGCSTVLSHLAIDCLGLNHPPDSLFFRGSQMTHTIGDLDLHSSSKRHHPPRAATGPVESENPQKADQLDSLKQNQIFTIELDRTLSNRDQTAENRLPEKDKSPAETSHPSQPEPRSTEVFTPVEVSCKSPQRTNRITLPGPLLPLLKRLTAPQVCRLMTDARRAGHRLEDVTTLCEEHILKSRSPMAYIRRLIKCGNDWAWLRNAAGERAQDVAKEEKATKALKDQTSIDATFREDNAGSFLRTPDGSHLITVDSFSCRVSWLEGCQVQERATQTKKVIEKIDSGLLLKINPDEAKAMVSNWYASILTSNGTMRPRRL